MIHFKNKNRTIVYPSCMTLDDVLNALRSRVSKRQKELDKRKWLYDEYVSLAEKQAIDEEWIDAILRGDVKNGS